MSASYYLKQLHEENQALRKELGIEDSKQDLYWKNKISSIERDEEQASSEYWAQDPNGY